MRAAHDALRFAQFRPSPYLEAMATPQPPRRPPSEGPSSDPCGRTTSPSAADPRPRVALFATCVGDRFFAEACFDAVRVLRHFGAEVHVPEGQTCCGQPAYNTGERAQAARMALHTEQVFRDEAAVVLPSGSCAATLRHTYPALLGSSSLAGRTWELSEFLVQVLGVAGAPANLGTGLAGVRVAYHHGCHALRELGVREEPLSLLHAFGAEIVPWEADMECCGFGGLFSTKFPAVSAGMADRKLDTLPHGVDVVTSADGGCLLQLSGRAARRNDKGRHGLAGDVGRSHPTFVHLATLIRRGIGL